jgi:putative endopeptidase
MEPESKIIELQTLNQHEWISPDTAIKKPRRYSLCGITMVLLAIISITVTALWGMTNLFGRSSMHYENSEDTLLLKTEAAWSPIAIDLFKTSNLDLDCCENPYLCACGGFVSSTTLTSGESKISKAITTMRNRHNALLETVVKEDWPIISPYYTSCNATWESTNFEKIDDLFWTIYNASSKVSLFKRLGHIRARHGFSLANFAFQIETQSDPYNSTARLVAFVEATTTLPSPVYYNSSEIIDLENYQRFIASMFALSPNPISSAEASDILAFENDVATLLVTTGQSLTMSQAFTRYDLEHAKTLLGNYISAYLDEMDILTPQHLNQVFVLNPEFFSAIDAKINSLPFTTLRNVALYSLFKQTYSLLGPSYFNTLKVLSSTLDGTSVHSITPVERETHCIRTLTSQMPMLVGHYYVVAAGIDAEFKQHITDITQIIRESLSDRLEENPWMDTATRVAAEEKIQAMHQQICYPDSWDSVLEFEQLLDGPLNPNDYFANTQRLHIVNDVIEFSSVLHVVDTGEWSFDFIEKFIETPEIINAFYAPNMNRFTIAAGITGPPFIYPIYDALPLLVSTFAGIGAVIGHELTHSLDNQGSRYNSKGELQNWWTDASRRQYSVESECIASSRSQQETQIPGRYIDGYRVLGESIADLGGIEAALDAMYAWETLKMDTEELKIYNTALKSVFPTMNKEQLFFMFFMQNYCEVQTDESVYEQVVSDPHPPGPQRVNGLLKDVPRFAEAFSCKVGSEYNEPESCSIF